jgi:predicted RNA-binding protein with PIN domain
MLFIDGYNLMYAAGIVGGGRGRGGLERSRAALCRFVAESLTEAERAGAVVVFDAAGAPPGLPDTLLYAGVKIRFAKGYADADELLEELIAADTAPRRSTVVSSDHRVQRAARRRRARAVDSDVWYEAALRKRREGPGGAGDDASKPAASVPTDAEVEFWLSRVIGDDAPSRSDRGRRSVREELGGLGGIFPPGYFDKDFNEEE